MVPLVAMEMLPRQAGVSSMESCWEACPTRKMEISRNQIAASLGTGFNECHFSRRIANAVRKVT